MERKQILGLHVEPGVPAQRLGVLACCNIAPLTDLLCKLQGVTESQRRREILASSAVVACGGCALRRTPNSGPEWRCTAVATFSGWKQVEQVPTSDIKNIAPGFSEFFPLEVTR